MSLEAQLMDYTTLGLGLESYLGQYGVLWLSRGSILMLSGRLIWYLLLCGAAWCVWYRRVILAFAGAIPILDMWVEIATLRAVSYTHLTLPTKRIV